MFKHHRHHHPNIEHPASNNGELPLSQLPAGIAARVARVRGGHWLVNRIACLGFTPGAEVSLLQNYGHGPLIAIVRGSRLALGRGESEHILVKIIEA